MSKVLVCYFSASGVTKRVAEKVSNCVCGELFEIVPVDKYTDEDLDWTNKESRSTKEMEDKSSRPKVLNKVENIDDYEKIVLGFPVWWYTAPTIINTFIEENDLTGKEVYVFVTSGSSSFAGSLNDLKNTYPNINFVKGIRFTSNISDKEILDFIN